MPARQKTAPLPPLGATVVDGRTTFRVWAPAARRVEIQLYVAGSTRRVRMSPDPAGAGLFVAELAEARAGTRYHYRLDGDDGVPDPCSRFQPDGVHAPSAVVEPGAFRWTDTGWRGLSAEGLVIYELHTGTFTPAGTFEAAIERLDYLRELGAGAIELMPVADFPGDRNWGYDGVALYAPSRAYGGPEGLWQLVDAAHARGLGVILDVVYNHLGPDGNYLRSFSPSYFTDRYDTPWGEAINFDGENSRPVREYVLQNAEYWLREYHVDGLRLDATHAIHDRSRPHLLAELSTRARGAVSPRGVVLIAENDANDVQFLTPVDQGGYGLDAVWADDFHHAVHVTLTGEREGYYQDFDGGAAEIARTVRGGFLYQGQPVQRSGRPRGTRVTSEPASAFVFCLQNHDQVGNRALGERLSHLVTPDLLRVATALLLFAPETPLLFMGQEFTASAPFLYFTDHNPELGRLVTDGRRSEFRGFSAFRDEALRDRIPDPQAESSFLRSKLDWREVETHAGMLALYRDLLALRRSDPVLKHHDRLTTEAVALDEHTLAVVRRAGEEFRLLVADLTPRPPSLTRKGGAPEVPGSDSYAAARGPLLTLLSLPWEGRDDPGALDADAGAARRPAHAVRPYGIHLQRGTASQTPLPSQGSGTASQAPLPSQGRGRGKLERAVRKPVQLQAPLPSQGRGRGLGLLLSTADPRYRMPDEADEHVAPVGDTVTLAELVLAPRTAVILAGRMSSGT